MKKNSPIKNNVQIVKLTWGAALILIGVAVFFRIPQVIPQLVQMGQSDTTVWFVRICFYLIGFMLIGGVFVGCGAAIGAGAAGAGVLPRPKIPGRKAMITSQFAQELREL